jgi:hypothetical protein
VDLQGRKSRLYLCGYCASQTADWVAGRLAYPAIPLDLQAVASLGPPGFFPHVRRLRPKPRNDGLRGLCLSFKALAWRWNRLSLVPPLVGFECCPSAGIPPARPLPGAEAPFGPALPHASSRSALVVSHHLDGLLRAKVTGLLHPATGLGFAAFRARRFPVPPEGDAVCRVALPATRFTPFEDFPSPAAVPHHCGRCLPVVTVLPGAGPDRGRCPCRPPPAEASDVHPNSLPAGRRAALPRGAGWPVAL